MYKIFVTIVILLPSLRLSTARGLFFFCLFVFYFRRRDARARSSLTKIRNSAKPMSGRRTLAFSMKTHLNQNGSIDSCAAAPNTLVRVRARKVTLFYFIFFPIVGCLKTRI